MPLFALPIAAASFWVTGYTNYVLFTAHFSPLFFCSSWTVQYIIQAEWPLVGWEIGCLFLLAQEISIQGGNCFRHTGRNIYSVGLFQRNRRQTVCHPTFQLQCSKFILNKNSNELKIISSKQHINEGEKRSETERYR